MTNGIGTRGDLEHATDNNRELLTYLVSEGVKIRMANMGAIELPTVRAHTSASA